MVPQAARTWLCRPTVCLLPHTQGCHASTGKILPEHSIGSDDSQRRYSLTQASSPHGSHSFVCCTEREWAKGLWNKITKACISFTWATAAHQMHVTQEVLRPCARVNKVLAVIILLPAGWPSGKCPSGSPTSSPMPVAPSAWASLWRPCALHPDALLLKSCVQHLSSNHVHVSEHGRGCT